MGLLLLFVATAAADNAGLRGLYTNGKKMEERVLNNEELEAVHIIERYGTALNAGDAVTIAEELFAADGQFYPAGQPTVVGTKALLETYEGLAKIPGGFKLTFTFRTVSVSGSGRQMMASVHSTSRAQSAARRRRSVSCGHW